MFVAQPGFLPARTSGLKFWYAGDRSAKTFNGSNVSQWNDLFVNGDHAVQATTTKQLLFVENSLNGLPGLEGDGIIDRMAATFSASISHPATIIIVVKSNDAAANAYIYDGIATSNRMALFSGGVGSEDMIAFSGAALTTTTAADTNAHYFTCVFDTTTSIIRRDGVQIMSGDSGTESLTGLSILSRFSDTAHANAIVYELFGFNKVLSASELIDNEFYVKNKYGV